MDWMADVDYNFYYPELDDDMMEEEFAENNRELYYRYLRNYTEFAMKSLQSSIKHILEDGRTSKLHHYELILNDKFNLNYFGQDDTFIQIFNKLITNKSVENEPDIYLIGLKLLYLGAYLIKKLEDEDFRNLVNIIMHLICNKNEPIPTYAIRCLQVFVYNRKRLKEFHPILKKLFKVLIKRLLVFISIQEDDKIINMPSDILDGMKIVEINKSLKDEGDRNVSDVSCFSIFDYIENTEILYAFQQKFHYMALIYYLLSIFEAEELLDEPLLFQLLYLCIDVSYCKSDALAGFSLLILYKMIDHQPILLKLAEEGLIDRILCIPILLSSSCYVVNIFSKLIENTNYIEKLLHYKNILQSILKYAVESYPMSSGSQISTIILKLFEYHDVFNNFEEIFEFKNVILGFKKIDWLKKIKIDHSLNFQDISNVSTIHHQEICKFCQLVEFYLVKNIIRSNPIFLEYRGILGENYDINDELCEYLLEYLEENGSLFNNTEVFNSYIDDDLFEVLVLILWNLLHDHPAPETIELFGVVSRILNYCTFIKGTRKLFLKSFELYPKMPCGNQSILSIFIILTSTFYPCKWWSQFLPFQTIHNLLASCFESFEYYRSYANQEIQRFSAQFFNESQTDLCIFKKRSGQVIDELIRNSYIFCLIDSVSNKKKISPCIKTKKYAIKSLWMLSLNDHVLQILSKHKYFFCEIFPKIMIDAFSDAPKHRLIPEIFKYSELIVYNINKAYGNNFELPCTILLGFRENFLDDNQNDSFLQFRKQNFKFTRVLSQHFKKINLNNFTESKNPVCNISSSVETGSQEKSFNEMNYSLFHSKLNKYENISDIHEPSYKYNITKVYHYHTEKYVKKVKFIKNNSILIPDEKYVHLFKNDTSMRKFSYNIDKVLNLNDSNNGHLISCCAQIGEKSKCFLWKYDYVLNKNMIEPCQIIDNVKQNIFSHDDMNLFVINTEFNIELFDIEAQKLVSTFLNNRRKYYYQYNTPQTSSNDKLILSNDELYCTVSGKHLHTFDRLNYCSSGIFSVSELEVLNGQNRFDIRTYKLMDQTPELKQCILRRTYNDNIYVGYGYTFHESYVNQTLEDGGRNVGPLSILNSINFIDSRTLAKLYVRNLRIQKYYIDNLNAVDIGRDVDRIAIIGKDSTFPKFKVWERGNREKIHIQTF